jgi:hypothetical protein
MLDLIGTKNDIEQLLAFAEAFGSATARADRERVLAKIRDQLERLRAADEKSRAELEEFYERVSEGGVGSAEAEQAALDPTRMRAPRRRCSCPYPKPSTTSEWHVSQR